MTFSFHTGFLFTAQPSTIGSLSSQTRLKQYNRQAGKQQPTLLLQAPPSLSNKRQGLEVARWLQPQGVNDWGMRVESKTETCANHCLFWGFFTFLVHCLTVLTSSEMTMSTHLVQGSLIFPICLFTMVSKAMSGVKRPVLSNTERTSHRRATKTTERCWK